MTETYDVTLAGVGYMVKPGSYKRAQAWASEGKVGRVRLSDFYGGGRRAFQNERDRFFGGVGAVPAYDSQGVTAGPKRQDKGEAPLTPIKPGDARWTFAYNGATYLVSGNGLYKILTSGGNYNGLSLLQTLGTTAVDATVLGTVIYVAFGAGVNVGQYDMSTGVWTASPTIGGVTRQARLLGREGLSLAFVLASDTATITTAVPGAGGSSSLPTDSYVRRLVQHDGHCWAICDTSVWRCKDNSTITQESTLTQLGYADDASWAVSHLGQLWTWVGRSVVVYDTRSDTVKDLSLPGVQRFRVSSLGGRTTYGACSVGTWLIVSVVNDTSGWVELWGFDGRGWWLLDAQTSSANLYRYPVSLLGAANDADFLAGRGTTNQLTSIWQLYGRAGQPGLANTWQLVTPLLDAGVRDVAKVWRRAGVELVAPEGGGSADLVTVQLEYSTNAGGTWTSVGTQSYSGSTFRDATLEAAITALPQAKRLQLRVSVSSVLDWCPVVASVWAEHETLDVPTRRRRWTMTLLCADQVAKRDGSVDTSGGRTLALGLWNAWDDGVPMAFKDVDYDLTGKTYTVRVSQIAEAIPKSNDAATFATSEVVVTLVEV